MREVTLKIGGNPYRLTALDARREQEFLDFARSKLPDPVQEVIDTAARLPDGYREKFLDQKLDAAIERGRLRGTPLDPDLEAFTRTKEGLTKMFALFLRPHHPHLTEADVWELLNQSAEEGDLERVADELQQAAHKVPMKEEDVERRYFRGGRATRKTKVVG